MTIFLQINCCLQEWESGDHTEVPFTVEAFSNINDDILDIIARVERDVYHGLSYQNAKKCWATSGMSESWCVASIGDFICFYIFVLRYFIPVHILPDQVEHRSSVMTLRRYLTELEV